MRCPTCGAATAAAAVHVDQTHRTVRIEVEGFPVLECERGHRTPALPHADDALVSAVEASLVAAARPALPWRPQRCGRCGAELTMPGRRAERAVTVATAGAPVFTVRMDLPLLRCIEDAIENVPRAAWRDAIAALRAVPAAAAEEHAGPQEPA